MAEVSTALSINNSDSFYASKIMEISFRLVLLKLSREFISTLVELCIYLVVAVRLCFLLGAKPISP
jgi:hypothetical protein